MVVLSGYISFIKITLELFTNWISISRIFVRSFLISIWTDLVFLRPSMHECVKICFIAVANWYELHLHAAWAFLFESSLTLAVLYLIKLGRLASRQAALLDALLCDGILKEILVIFVSFERYITKYVRQFFVMLAWRSYMIKVLLVVHYRQLHNFSMFLMTLFVLSQRGRSSLHMAVELGHEATIKEIIQAGADVNLRDRVSKPYG